MSRSFLDFVHRAALSSALTIVMASTVAPAQAYPRPGTSTQLDVVPRKPAPTAEAINTSLSASGRFVAFDTASRLVEVDDNGQSDVYVRDMKTHRIWLASIGNRGDAAQGLPGLSDLQGRARWNEPLSWDPSMSADGRYVAFVSRAVNLVEDDRNQATDIFVFDRKKNRTERVSVDSKGGEGSLLEVGLRAPHSWAPSIDGRGRRITFTSRAAFVPEDDNDSADVYVHDRKSDRTRLVSVGRGGATASAGCADPAGVEVLPCNLLPNDSLSDASSISADGRFVAFQSMASNLVQGDSNEVTDAFVRDLSRKRTERVSVTSAEREVGGSTTIRAAGWFLESNSFDRVEHAISGNGRYVVFSSHADDLVPNDREQSFDLETTDPDYFVRDRKLGRTEKVSVSSTGSEVDNWTSGDIEVAAISADGRFVTFPAHLREPAAPKGSPPGSGIFVYDRVAGSLEISSRKTDGSIGTGCRNESTPAGDPGWSGVSAPDIDSDGRHVSFSSCNSTMYTYGSDDGEIQHVFLRDRGVPVGVDGHAGRRKPDAPADEGTCAAGFCLPPVPAPMVADAEDDGSIAPWTDVVGARAVERRDRADIFIVEEIAGLETTDPVKMANGDLSPIVYGVSLKRGRHRLEARAVGVSGGSFGLFDCTDASPTPCRFLRTSEGGFGTTGDRIVFSFPLRQIGARAGSHISDIEVFTALGTFHAGATKILDSVAVGSPAVL